MLQPSLAVVVHRHKAVHVQHQMTFYVVVNYARQVVIIWVQNWVCLQLEDPIFFQSCLKNFASLFDFAFDHENYAQQVVSLQTVAELVGQLV